MILRTHFWLMRYLLLFKKPLFKIALEYEELMKNPKNQRTFADIMKLRKAKIRKEKFEWSIGPMAVQFPMAFQLPTVIISGAKKCGTKVLMRFFGHHPQVIIGKTETPFHQSGDDEYDVKNYLQLVHRIWKLDDNKRKLDHLALKRLRGQQTVFMAKTANKGIKKIMAFVEAHPDFIPLSYIKTWAQTVRSITG